MVRFFFLVWFSSEVQFDFLVFFSYPYLSVIGKERKSELRKNCVLMVDIMKHEGEN